MSSLVNGYLEKVPAYIVGIDPAPTATGVCIVRTSDKTVIAYACFNSCDKWTCAEIKDAPLVANTVCHLMGFLDNLPSQDAAFVIEKHVVFKENQLNTIRKQLLMQGACHTFATSFNFINFEAHPCAVKRYHKIATGSGHDVNKKLALLKAQELGFITTDHNIADAFLTALWGLHELEDEYNRLKKLQALQSRLLKQLPSAQTPTAGSDDPQPARPQPVPQSR
jgi:Holliday junction resolvasome RuvABC endonuclease subunit